MQTATPIKYIINEENISLYHKGESRLVTKQNQQFLYESLRKCLLEGTGELNFTELITDPRTLIMEGLKNKAEFLGLGKRVALLQEQGLPLEPLLNFVRRCPEHILRTDAASILQQVGTSDLPLTWQGDIVAYQRASWLPYSNKETRTTWVNNFEPFRVVKDDQRRMTVGGFDWTQNHCPDAGMTFEVIVQPEHLISCSTYNSSYLVSEVTQLSMLDLRPRDEDKAETGVVDFVTSCTEFQETMVVRLPYNAGTAAKMIASMFRTPTSYVEAYNKVATVQVPVGASC